MQASKCLWRNLECLKTNFHQQLRVFWTKFCRGELHQHSIQINIFTNSQTTATNDVICLFGFLISPAISRSGRRQISLIANLNTLTEYKIHVIHTNQCCLWYQTSTLLAAIMITSWACTTSYMINNKCFLFELKRIHYENCVHSTFSCLRLHLIPNNSLRKLLRCFAVEVGVHVIVLS